jgi:hypothetical protein
LSPVNREAEGIGRRLRQVIDSCGLTEKYRNVRLNFGPTVHVALEDDRYKGRNANKSAKLMMQLMTDIVAQVTSLVFSLIPAMLQKKLFQNHKLGNNQQLLTKLQVVLFHLSNASNSSRDLEERSQIMSLFADQFSVQVDFRIRQIICKT